MHREIYLTFDEFVRASRALKCVGFDEEPVVRLQRGWLAVDPDRPKCFVLHSGGLVEEEDPVRMREVLGASELLLSSVANAWTEAPSARFYLDEGIVERFVPDWRRIIVPEEENM